MLDREFTYQHLRTAGRFYPAQLRPLPPRHPLLVAGRSGGAPQIDTCRLPTPPLLYLSLPLSPLAVPALSSLLASPVPLQTSCTPLRRFIGSQNVP